MSFDEQLARLETSQDGGHSVSDRLLAFSRLLTVVADELEALERRDMAKRRELAEARDKLTRELQNTAEGEADELTPCPQLADELSRLLAGVLEALQHNEEEERWTQIRWSSLEEDALRAIHVGGRIVSLRSGRYPDERPLDARVDVRF